MAQFADATIAILTDDDEDSSEDEIYRIPEPETESTDERRPMIGRLSRSRVCADGQSDESDGLLGIIKNGASNGKLQRNGDVSGSAVQPIITGSSGFLGTSLSPTTVLVLCLLIAAFPVHFPSILLPDIRSTDVVLQMTVSLAIVGAIASSVTSQLALKMADGNFRSLLIASCMGVMVFAVIRCFRAAPVAVLGSGSFVAGFLLTAVRVIAAGEYCRPSPSLQTLDGPRPPRRRGIDAATCLACGLLVAVCSGMAPTISASLYLVLLATYPLPSAIDTGMLVTSLMTSSPTVNNATHDFSDFTANLSSWSNVSSDVNISSSVPTPIISSFSESTSSSYSSRLEALSVCYVVCSLGALLFALFPFDDDPYRKDKSSWTVSGVGRLVLGPLSAFRRQDVASLSLLAVFVGAQQLFAYFAYILAFVPLAAGIHAPVMAGLAMAGTALLISGPVGYLLRYVGRVKLLLPVVLVMTSLLLSLLLLDETRSRAAETYIVIGCLLGACDSCLQVCFAALVCQLSDDADDDDDDDGGTRVVLQGALTSCYSVGQLLAFLLHIYSATTTPTLICLLVLLPLAVFGFLAAEIHLRLADEDGETGWCGGRGRRQYVAVRMDDERTTWLPQYDPLESPRKDRVRPLFDDRS